MNTITISELETLFTLIIQKLKRDHLETLETEMDEYWIILSDQWNDLSKTPELAVGSLTDDVNYLKEAIREKEIVSYSDLDRVATVLRVISEHQAPTSE